MSAGTTSLPRSYGKRQRHGPCLLCLSFKVIYFELGETQLGLDRLVIGTRLGMHLLDTVGPLVEFFDF